MRRGAAQHGNRMDCDGGGTRGRNGGGRGGMRDNVSRASAAPEFGWSLPVTENSE